jgi:hypothetical protein
MWCEMKLGEDVEMRDPLRYVRHVQEEDSRDRT